MHVTKTINAPVASSGKALPSIALLGLSVLPLLTLQLSMVATLQIVALLSLAIVVLAHIANQKSFDVAHAAIKLISPVQFAFVIWLAVTFGRELGGASFVASYAASLGCLFGIVAIDALASASALLVAGRTGVSLATLISGKYAGLLGGVE